ncbi:hypothetical protein ACFQVC_23575 [Streptomyces monticola]|uniref:Secreted protein n=1 Tax=Streptomyces monticola TaxID=2666263 RepID=A0ABW2JPB4_9ACTN
MSVTRKYRRAGFAVGPVLLAGAGVAASGVPAGADTATATATATARSPQGAGKSSEAEAALCRGVAGIYGVSSTKSYKGRDAELWTERIEDDKARAYVTDIAKGDTVQIQRSYKKFTMTDKPQHPATVGRYDSCGNKASWAEANVGDWMATDAVQLQIPGTGRSYAVRTCIFPVSGGRGCTKWYVDHK